MRHIMSYNHFKPMKLLLKFCELSRMRRGLPVSLCLQVYGCWHYNAVHEVPVYDGELPTLTDRWHIAAHHHRQLSDRDCTPRQAKNLRTTCRTWNAYIHQRLERLPQFSSVSSFWPKGKKRGRGQRHHSSLSIWFLLGQTNSSVYAQQDHILKRAIIFTKNNALDLLAACKAYQNFSRS